MTLLDQHGDPVESEPREEELADDDGLVDLPPLSLDQMSIMERVALLDPDQRREVLADMTEQDLASPDAWLRPKQLSALRDDAWLIAVLAGRGEGKTKTGTTWVNEKARDPGTRIHLVARTVADVRDVVVQGESGILATALPGRVPEYHPSLRKLVWPNGSTAQTFSSEQPSQLRGPQAHYTFCDELSAWRHVPDDSGATAWDHVKIGTRLGAHPQIFASMTPKRHRVVRDIVDRGRHDPRVSVHYGSTLDNRANLSPEYLSTLLAMYRGTALERQEIYGELLLVVEGAVWQERDVRLAPVPDDRPRGRLWRVVGVDPGVTTGGDATGIVVAYGEAEPRPDRRRAWVVDDLTEPGLAPERWAARVVATWRRHDASDAGEPAFVVAEKNQGGELVRTVIKQVEPRVPVALIHASVSKAARAEPCVLAYRQRRVAHAQDLPELVEEMTGWEPKSRWSPNRMDAMVHGLRAILVDDSPLRRLGTLTLHSDLLDQRLEDAVAVHRRDRPEVGAWRRARDGSPY